MVDEKQQSGITVRSIIFGLVLLVIIILLMSVGAHMRSLSWMNPSWPVPIVSTGDEVIGKTYFNANFLPVIAFSFIPIVVNAILPRKSRFSLSELAVINAMIFPAMIMPGFIYGVSGVPMSLLRNFFNANLAGVALEQTPELWVPKDLTVLEPVFPGGATVPWGAWTLSMAYWFVFFIALYMCQIFGACLLRKTYIETEALTFPYAKLATETLNLTTGNKSEWTANGCMRV